MLRQKAQTDLLIFLLRQIAELAAPPLYSYFVQFLKSSSPEGKLLPSDADINQNHYADFLKIMQNELLQSLLDEKPVLTKAYSKHHTSMD